MIASSSPKRRLAGLAAASLAALLVSAVADPAAARSNREREPKRDDSVLSRPAGVPLMAIVSLGEQRVTIYDAEGRILRAPVSTGQTGYETPAGIYSVIQKEAEHYSNLYDDASMPFMQRITWSGIALHAGVLPGHPASHGCIRMPHAVRRAALRPDQHGHAGDRGPDRRDPCRHRASRAVQAASARWRGVACEPARARAGTGSADAAGCRRRATMFRPPTIPPRRLETLKSIAAAKAAEAEAAARKADEARSVAAKLATESARLAKAQRLAEGAKNRAEALVKSAEEALAAAGSNANPNPTAIERAQEAKAKAEAKVAEAQAQLDAAKAAAEPKVEALTRAREEAKTAEAAKVAAATAAKEAAAKMSPVSVFISRQTQRLYVRQAFQPIFDTPITIKDADQPIGTHIYTALDYVKDGADVRWSAVSMTSSQGRQEPESTRRRSDFDGYGYARRSQRVDRNAEPVPADVDAAKAALDRLSIPQEAIDRIAEVISPGSVLIVSDEALSKETGKGTDFIVVMSGEPQGGIKIRRRPQPWGGDYERPYGRSPYGRNPSFWW